MTTAQEGRQAAVRGFTGTSLDYNGDWEALFDLNGISPEGGFNGRFLAWINLALGTSYTELNGAMTAYAAANGAVNWSSLGTVVQGGGGPVLNALTISPQAAIVGSAYSGAVSGRTAGSTLTLSGTGAAGLSIDSSTGAVSGTPTTAGPVNVVETLAGAIGSPKTTTVSNVLPVAVHDADYANATGNVGDTLSTVPNIGSNASAFTFVSTREFTVGQRYGKKTGVAETTDAMNLPAVIPVGSYTAFLAFQATNIASNRNLLNQTKGSIDILWADNAIRHNGTAVPANGFNVAACNLGGLVVEMDVYDATTGTATFYRNGVSIGSGSVPTRSGTPTGAVINNANSPNASGIAGDYLATKTWNVALPPEQAVQAMENVRAAYNAKYDRFIPPTAQKAYAFWTDSMSVIPDVPTGVGQQFGLQYTPNAYCFNGGVAGNTSTQVLTRFNASALPYKDKTTFFWCMRNDPGAAIDTPTGIANIQAMINQLDDPTRFVVPLSCWTNTEFAAGPGNANYDAIAQRRAAQMAAWPNNWVDVTDIIQAGHTGDGQHPDAAGAILIAQRFKTFTDGKGW